jgi:hypothetical protein
MPAPIATIMLVLAVCGAIVGSSWLLAIGIGLAFGVELALFIMAGRTDGVG